MLKISTVLSLLNKKKTNKWHMPEENMIIFISATSPNEVKQIE